MKKLLFSLIAILFAINAYAQPSTITYQGVLTNAGGAVQNGTFDIKFDICTGLNGANSVWTETHEGVQVTNGLFQVELGSVTAFSTIPLDFSTPYWLEITIDPSGTPVVLSPRIAFNASGYSINAGTATGLSSASTITIETTANDADINLSPNGLGQVYASGIFKADQMDIGTAGDGQAPFLYVYDGTDNGGSPLTEDPTVVLDGTGKITVGNGDIQGGIELSSGEPDGIGYKYVKLEANSSTESYTLTLPANDGDNGQVLTTNGSGVTSWAAAGGGGGTIIQATSTGNNIALSNVAPNEVWYQRFNVTVTGAEVGDAVIVNLLNLPAPAGSSPFTSDILSVYAWVSATDEVTVHIHDGFCGCSTANNVTFLITVIQP